jgi:hypothetical protein
MKKITVNLADLEKMVKDMKKDRMQLVVVTFEDPDEDLPACLTFHATTDRDCPELVDYGEVDAVEGLRL